VILILAATAAFAQQGRGRGADPVMRNPGQFKGTLEHYNIKLTLHETGGGHTCINWREYLKDFAPRLFR
jgi:hypothetical protein